MSDSARRLVDYLEHVLQAMERIDRFVGAVDEHRFKADDMVQDAVIRNLEVRGEASRNILTRFPDFAAAHPELPLAAAYQMRNAISHGYYKVDFSVVWQTVVSDIPDFRSKATVALISLLKGGLASESSDDAGH